jgi:hypothetical protein
MVDGSWWEPFRFDFASRHFRHKFLPAIFALLFANSRLSMVPPSRQFRSFSDHRATTEQQCTCTVKMKVKVVGAAVEYE